MIIKKIAILYSRYTKEEDEKIVNHITKKGPSGVNKKCAELSKILNRKRHSIWQRYQKLKMLYNLKPIEDSYESDFESEDEKDTKNKKKSTSVNKSYKDDSYKTG